MIRYFRINDPYRLVGLFVLLLIIYLPLFILDHQMSIPELKDLVLGEKQNEGYRMYHDVVDNTAPLAAWVHEILDSVFGRSIFARHVLAFMIIFLQSAFVGLLFISKKVFNENSYIPSFLYSLLFFFSSDTLSLSDELLGSGFLLLALNNIFQEIEFRHERDESIFNVGLCISLASLFAFAFVVYLLCAIVILLFFTRSNARKYLLLIFGFLLPHLLTLTIAYLNGSTSELWKYYYLANLSLDRAVYVDISTLLVLSALPLAYLLISLVMLNRDARFSKYQSQILQATLLWMVFSCFFVLYSKDLRPQTFIVFIPGLSMLLTHFFLLIRRKKFIHLNSWILFGGIVSIAYLARFEKLESVDYSGLWVRGNESGIKGKRILVLGDSVSLYKDNELATPFLNWDLSAEIFKSPDYYRNVTRVYHHFTNDPPDIVIDPQNHLRAFLDRMPSVQKEYVRQGDRYIRRVNN